MGSNAHVNSETWQAIRALRAAPSGVATKHPDRRRTFGASLRQAVGELPVGQDASGSELGERVEPANLLQDVERLGSCDMRRRSGDRKTHGSGVMAVDFARRLELAWARARLELTAGTLGHLPREAGIAPTESDLVG